MSCAAGDELPLAIAACPLAELHCSLEHVQDLQVRLWDLRGPQCQGMVQCPGPPTAAFDQQGLVFCIACDSGTLKLYDVRSYDKGPFDTFTVSFAAYPVLRPICVP